VNFVDKVLLQLADPTERVKLFDQDALALLLAAAYRVDEMAMAGPYAAYFDELRLGFAIPPLGALEGAWQPVGSVERTQAEFKIAGLGDARPPRIDAFWRGAVSARYADSGEPIEEADVEEQPFPTLAGIDAEIVAAAGALPTDPADLEDARREQLRADADAAAPDPGSVTRQLVDGWIREGGFEGVAAFLAAARSAPWIVQELRLVFAAPVAAPKSPRLLPLAAAILVREDGGFSLSELLAESKDALQRVAALGLELPKVSGTRSRRGVLVVWVLPDGLFDDPDWPGANGGTAADKRAARRAKAGAWLAQEGIALVTVP
jgi:hypothetical protein